jgi:hypothetical protein
LITLGSDLSRISFRMKTELTVAAVAAAAAAVDAAVAAVVAVAVVGIVDSFRRQHPRPLPKNPSIFEEYCRGEALWRNQHNLFERLDSQEGARQLLRQRTQKIFKVA